jgi:hypothetical protein
MAAARALPARREEELQMKRLTLACLLLNLCTSSSIVGQSVQGNLQARGESKCSAGFKECRESLNDFKEAGQFMQLKATVLADLVGIQNAKATKAKIAPIPGADTDRLKTGNAVVYGAIIGPAKILAVPAKSASRPVSFQPAVGMATNKRMP